MKLFLPRLTASVTKAQLRRFAAAVLDEKFCLPFTPKPSLDDCEILRVTGQHGVVEQHGLVSITPEPAARWFIKHARGKTLGNKRVLVREYFDRNNQAHDFSAENDRRDNHSNTEKVRENRIYVEGQDQFKREHR